MDIEVVSGDESLSIAEGIRLDDVIISVRVRRKLLITTVKPDVPPDVAQYVKGSSICYDVEGGKQQMQAGITEAIVSMVVSRLNVDKIRTKIARYSNVVEVTPDKEAVIKQYFSRFDETKLSAEDCRKQEEF